MTIVLASNNMGKLREFRELLAPLGLDVVPQALAGIDFAVNETGDTFEENAYLKASTAAAYTSFPAVADDSGLCVDALGGAPGVYSARYGGGKEWTDRQRYEYLLRELDGAEDRRAKFVCCIVCVLPGGDIIRARGECPGRILEAPRGEAGFGYDPVFAPEGFQASFAELGDEIKNTLSHRAKALAAFQKELKERGIC